MFKDSGFSLIEVLISLIILGLVLLGFDAMEIFSVRQTREAYYFHLAQNQLFSMAERLRAHPATTEISQQLTLWNQENQRLLPAGKGHVSQKDSMYQITLFWGEKTHQKVCPKMQRGELHCLCIQV